jgi:hypothetical protein
MASPAALGALLEALKAELARRARTTAAAAEQVQEQLWDELEEMGRRFLAVTRPHERSGFSEGAALVEELMQANGDWSRIDEIRIREDLAVADCVALVLTRDLQTAVRLLVEYCRKY